MDIVIVIDGQCGWLKKEDAQNCRMFCMYVVQAACLNSTCPCYAEICGCGWGWITYMHITAM